MDVFASIMRIRTLANAQADGRKYRKPDSFTNENGLPYSAAARCLTDVSLCLTLNANKTLFPDQRIAD